MAKQEKILRQVQRGRSDANIRFADLCNLLRSLGFEERTSSSHHLFVTPGVEELINLQRESGKAKPYRFGRSARSCCDTDSGTRTDA